MNDSENIVRFSSINWTKMSKFWKHALFNFIFFPCFSSENLDLCRRSEYLETLSMTSENVFKLPDSSCRILKAIGAVKRHSAASLSLFFLPFLEIMLNLIRALHLKLKKSRYLQL